LCGRGFGKNWTGAHIVDHVAKNPELCGGRAKQHDGDRNHGEGGVIGIAGRTANDVNQTIVYGPSGIMTLAAPWFRPIHKRQDRLLIWPNGVIARLFSGDVPESFRGPNIGFFWGDEMAHWKKLAESWSMVKLTLRHGKNPRGIITTTPLGVTELVKLVYECKDGIPLPAKPGTYNDGRYQLNPKTRVVRGSTYDNAANLAENFLEEVVADFEGTELGAQELHGVIILGIPGALWKQDWFRRCNPDEVPELSAIVVAVDPAVSEGQDACETGIVVVGVDAKGDLFLLEDASGKHTPEAWALEVLRCYEKWDADWIAGEENQGGALIEGNLRHHKPRARFKFQGVRATQDKAKRASLVNGMWQAGRVRHVGRLDLPNKFLKMEYQLTHFNPNRPAKGQPSDRMDAVVWAALSLLAGGSDKRRVQAMSNVQAWRNIREQMQRRRAV
jgi:phage terminase large subunit-like protein